MPITTRILTPIDIPQEVEIEIEDTVRGTKTVRTIDFHRCLLELGELGTVDLEEVDPEQLIALACALAKHRAIDEYLISIGIDPHAHLHDTTGATEAMADEG